MSKQIEDETFTFDTIEEIFQDLHDMSGEEKGAEITYDTGKITVTICRFRDASIQVYQVDETPDLYHEIGQAYTMILETISTGDDYWDKLTAIEHVLGNHKLVDTTLNP